MSTIKEKCEVVILPTKDKKSRLIYSDAYHGTRNILVYLDKKSCRNDRKHHLRKRFHLYVLSNEKIKKGDYYIDDINEVRKSITSDKEYWESRPNYKKIIATTDKSLNLYQIPENFIRHYINKYNQGNIITEVLVEYNYLGGLGGQYQIKKLKVNPDNTITIHPVKDSWNREEVISLLECGMTLGIYYEKYGSELSPTEELEGWIRDNL